MKRRTFISLMSVMAAAGVLTLAGCSSNSGSSAAASGAASSAASTGAADQLAAIQANGKLVVALEGAWQPWSYHDESDTLVGYDVEVSRAIAEKLGVEPEYVESDWDSLFAGLDAGRFDIVCNGVEVTDERAKTYDFTTPYGYIHTALAVRKDNEDIKSFEDLDGKLVANALEGSNGKLAKSYGAELTPAGLAEAMTLLKDHRADAQIEDQIVMALYLEGKPDMKQYVKQVAFYEPADITEMQVAGCFRIADKELVEACNQALADMKADGTLYDLAVKYLSQDVADSLDVFTK